MNVYITDIAAFLPNAPVNNDDMERVLGMIRDTPSRVKKIILRNNKILTRYYAIDPDTGKTTHTNAALTAEAIRRLAPREGFDPAEIQCLCCGTSTPDQLLPGHGLMVHGELGSPPCEAVSSSGICLAGLTALKYAAMNVAMGLSDNAAATGSELASSFLRAAFCQPADLGRLEEVKDKPILAFDADFLRFMLSDGAGAVFIEREPRPGRLALRLDWIEHVSLAGEFPACMYAGAVKNEDGTLTGWRELAVERGRLEQSAFLIQQDVKLLNGNIVTAAVDRTLAPIAAKRGVRPEDYDWFLPHYSSDFFRPKLRDRMREIGFDIDEAKWFSNLRDKGNTGSASFFIILEELFHSGRLTPGQKLLCLIPESGRFSMSYVQLSVMG